MSFVPPYFARRTFRLAQFELAPLEFCENSSAELAELLLDPPVAAAGPSSTVVAFPQALPTPGEMHERIERHLEARDDGGPAAVPACPAEELRLALAELRRSLG
jgi:hypothetical protein